MQLPTTIHNNENDYDLVDSASATIPVQQSMMEDELSHHGELVVATAVRRTDAVEATPLTPPAFIASNTETVIDRFTSSPFQSNSGGVLLLPSQPTTGTGTTSSIRDPRSPENNGETPSPSSSSSHLALSKKNATTAGGGNAIKSCLDLVTEALRIVESTNEDETLLASSCWKKSDREIDELIETELLRIAQLRAGLRATAGCFHKGFY